MMIDVAPAPPSAPAYPFGEVFTRSMVTAQWTAEDGWQPAVLSDRAPLPMDPAMVGLHYGQAVFEGLKAYRQPDGAVRAFRAADHARRLQASARRLAMPELPTGLFLDAVAGLIGADGAELPDDPALSLYLRPLLYASEPSLALRPARRYAFLLIAFITGGFFADRPEPVAVWVSRDQVRAVAGGTGGVKFAGNYAPTYLAQQRAEAAGCRQVIWLDAEEHRWIEEMGGMNVFFVHGAGSTARVTTPPLTGTLLPGVTRDTLLSLSERLGLRAAEEPLSVEDWRDGCRTGAITEAFATGTGAGVTPIGTVHDGADVWQVGDGEPGPVTLRLRDALDAVQRGRAAAPGAWRQGAWRPQE